MILFHGPLAAVVLDQKTSEQLLQCSWPETLHACGFGVSPAICFSESPPGKHRQDTTVPYVVNEMQAPIFHTRDLAPWLALSCPAETPAAAEWVRPSTKEEISERNTRTNQPAPMPLQKNKQNKRKHLLLPVAGLACS